MITKKINGLNLEIYNSVEELPIVNFHKYNKYMLIESGLASDLKSIDDKIAKIAIYISKDNKDLAIKELENMQSALYYAMHEITPKSMAFVCLIHSINGIKLTDLSDDNISKVLASINIERSLLLKLMDSFKKKIQSELDVYFPNRFEDVDSKKVYAYIKQKALLELDEIIRENDNSKQIADIEYKLMIMQEPLCFRGPKSKELEFDKNFEETCMFISSETGINAKSMSTIEFYTIENQLKKKYSKNGKK